MWLALVIVGVAVIALVLATAVMARRLSRRPPPRGIPPAAQDWEHSVGDHASIGVYREHLE
jgi:hypothetical protein